MTSIQEQKALFTTNWHLRNDGSKRWQRIHRNFARQAVSELRFLTNRQRKNLMTKKSSDTSKYYS